MWEFSLVANISSETTKIGKISKISEKYCMSYELMLSENTFSPLISVGKNAYFILQNIYKNKNVGADLVLI